MAEQDDKDKVYSDEIYTNRAVDCADTNSDMHEALFLSHSLSIRVSLPANPAPGTKGSIYRPIGYAGLARSWSRWVGKVYIT